MSRTLKPAPPSPGGVPPEPVLRQVRIPFVRRAQLLHSGVEREVFLVDLGLFGAFVELAEPVEAGGRAELRFALPGNDIPLAAACRIAWHHPPDAEPKELPPGIGLEFTDMSEADRARVRTHLVEHCRLAARSRRFSRPWPRGGRVG